jgi:hypothetical protein
VLTPLTSRIAWKGVVNLPQQVSDGVLPDLQDFSLEQLAGLGDSALAHSLALYLERLREDEVLFNRFNNLIS